MPPPPRRPRADHAALAFLPAVPVPAHAPRLRARSRGRQRRVCARWRAPPRLSASPSQPQPSHPSQTQQPDRAREVRTRLETTRARVRALNSRAIVRAGAAGISLGAALLRDADPAAPDPGFGQLRRDLRALRRAAEELPLDDPAMRVVAELADIVDAVERRAMDVKNRQSADVDADGVFVVDEVEELIEGRGGVEEDSAWGERGSATTDGDDRLVFVKAVRRSVAAKGDQLKRTASTVGAGIEERVAEFVKDDGSIDVDGLRALVGSLLDTASMTWKRLNGRVPPSRELMPGGDAAADVANASLSVRDEEKEFELREQIGELEKKLNASSKEREAVLRREDQLGKLIRAKEIRLMDDGVSALRRTLAVRVLQLEMEKIFVSVADEIENSDYETMLEQRVLVAEFGDLDERLAALEVLIGQGEPLLVADDTLGELASDILDLKTRLGLDEALYSSATLSWPQVQQFVTATARKSREGADFYWRGLRLFAGDVRFALRLIRRAIVGYTPSPREIRTLRRTGRDLLTLVPFTIVLIAPLTPVGHVLIFSFLQRYWPEFFPSTFSERRQEVMKRHEAYAQSLRKDADDGGDRVDEGGDDGDGDGGRSGGGSGPFSGLRRAVAYGVFGAEVTEDVEDVDGEGEERKSSGQGAANGKIGGGNGVAEREEDGVEEHPIELSGLAESARDSGKMARKRRSAVALDELHLAD